MDDKVVVTTIRMTPADKDLLRAIAKLEGTQPAVLAKRFLLEGLERATSPNEIAKDCDEKKARALAIAAELRNAFPDALS